MARSAPWLALFAAYAAAALLLDAPAPELQAPRLLENLDGLARDLLLAAVAAAAFAFAASLARRWAPDPWASRSVWLAALSPAGFLLSGSTAAPPALLLAAGTLGAILTRDAPTRLRTLGGAAALALVPWFGLPFAVAAAPVLAALVYWSYRRGRRMYAFLALEFGGATVVTLAGVETSAATGPAVGMEGLAELALAAPVLVLVALTAFLLARSRREKLARAIPTWRDAELAAGLTGITALAVLACAAFEPIGPEACVPLLGALGAWAMRSFPRVGAAVALVTLALSAWTIVAIAVGEQAGWLLDL